MTVIHPTCEYCGHPTVYCDSVPDASIYGYSQSECGYRLVALCLIHGAERRQVATSRLQDVIVINGVGYIDRNRAGGDCVCDICGKKYHDHPAAPELIFLNQLCDGSLVKL